jgi:hypothetical protein
MPSIESIDVSYILYYATIVTSIVFEKLIYYY